MNSEINYTHDEKNDNRWRFSFEIRKKSDFSRKISRKSNNLSIVRRKKSINKIDEKWPPMRFTYNISSKIRCQRISYKKTSSIVIVFDVSVHLLLFRIHFPLYLSVVHCLHCVLDSTALTCVHCMRKMKTHKCVMSFNDALCAYVCEALCKWNAYTCKTFWTLEKPCTHTQQQNRIWRARNLITIISNYEQKKHSRSQRIDNLTDSWRHRCREMSEEKSKYWLLFTSDRIFTAGFFNFFKWRRKNR